jgi:peptide/nickel transport system ATP-binding protein
MVSLNNAPLIRIRGLTVTHFSRGQPIAALREVDFDIARGEIVGILGESGAGKSTLALSVLGLLPVGTTIHGSIVLRGNEHSVHDQNHDLLRLNEKEWSAIRGARISMIFQEPALSLSPVMRVGDQIAEVLRAHRRDVKHRRQRVEEVLRKVQLSNTDRIDRAYPHQLSGGELHRAAIAQALVCGPELVIADEPTRSLDVTVQGEILKMLMEVNRELGSALIFITHNPALLANFADRVAVMYAGRIVEQGPVSQVFRRPLHPYTKALLQLAQPLSRDSALDNHGHLPAIPGSWAESPVWRGCAFEPRCSARTGVCREDSPTTVTPEPNHSVSCFNHGN